MTMTKKAICLTGLITFLSAILILSIQAGTQKQFISALGIAGFALAFCIIATGLTYWIVLQPLKKFYIHELVNESQTGSNGNIVTNDPVTGLLNRRGITIQLLESMAHTQRYGSPLTVVLIDVDHLKSINEKHGKKTADNILAKLAAILVESLRMPDRLGNYEGGRFLAILPETKLDAAYKITDRIRDTVGNTAFEVTNGEKINVTISIGITQYQKNEDLPKLLARVEGAIHNAKGQGRNVVASN